MSSMASAIQSKVKRIQDRLIHCLDMQRSGTRNKAIGDALADIIATSIVRQVDVGKQPDGQRLAPLSRRWLLWKMTHGKNSAILHEDDHMMDLKQVKGIVVISKDAMTMFYGLDADAWAKAQYAEEGQINSRGVLHGLAGHKVPRSGWNRPPRPFFDLNANTWDRIDDYLDAEIDAEIMGLGARRI